MDPQQARKTYNRIGRIQDSQAFYERAPVDDLIAHLDLGTARRVIEIGCGTGKLARRLLDDELSDDATYLGLDISDTMVRHASQVLEPYESRAEVRRVDFIQADPGSFGSGDRVISTYVLDLLTPAQADSVLRSARAVLKPNGLLGLVSITEGTSGMAALVSTVWTAIAKRRPGLLGGCRPVDLRQVLDSKPFVTQYHATRQAWGITSEIVIARPVGQG